MPPDSTETDPMQWGILERTLGLLPDPITDDTTKPCGHQVTKVEGARGAPLTMQQLPNAPVGVLEVLPVEGVYRDREELLCKG